MICEWISQMGRGFSGTLWSCDCSTNVPQHERRQRDYQHHSRRHEFLCLSQANGENDQECGQEDIGDVRLEDNVQGAQGQHGSEGGGRDERNLAFGLEEANEATDHEQHDIDPKDRVRVVMHGRKVP